MSEMADREKRARKHPVFRIENDQVLSLLELKPRERFRYAIDEFWEKTESLDEQAKVAHQKERAGETLDVFEKKLLEIQRKLVYHIRLARLEIPHLIPPSGVASWRTFDEAMASTGDAATVDAWMKMIRTYGSRDAAGFNAAVAEYRERMLRDFPEDARKAAVENWFNHWDPFNVCKWLYLFAFALACLAWLGWTGPLDRAAWRLMAFLWVVHTVALVLRIYLSGRPPVTNLYSSAIFIGWGTVLLGLVLERIFRVGVGNVVAAATGFATLQIAHLLAADGDTMEVLQAVLDTQFWLATHVTTITIGYATTYVAGLIGLILILRGVLTPSLSPELARTLTRMIYGVTCFSMFFSFVGTVLGGLWADDSWGRFWGWDPKENGALMIVLWNVLILHARWGGLVRERGLAVLCVFGNVVVSWSWFGVNNLGKGLHAYGFTEGRAFWLLLFVLSQMLVVGAGMLPRKFWRSPEAVREPKAVGS
jgi:ABC-type transport system involved in cytochrome c biogenesis permease subunit